MANLHGAESPGDEDTPCNGFCKPPQHVALCYTIEHVPDCGESVLDGFQLANPLVDVISVKEAPEAPPMESHPQFEYARGTTDPTKAYLVTWTWRRGLAEHVGVRFPEPA